MIWFVILKQHTYLHKYLRELEFSPALKPYFQITSALVLLYSYRPLNCLTITGEVRLFVSADSP